MVKTLAPPESLLLLSNRNAEFDLSRAGGIRIWLDGRIYAADSASDCDNHGARPLTPEETQYLGAYLIFLGRRWNDLDQLRLKDEEDGYARD